MLELHGSNDEPRWVEPEWEPFSPPKGAPDYDPERSGGDARPLTGLGGDARPLTGLGGDADVPTLPSAIVVAGTVGSAGATTLAIVLGVVLGTEARRKVLILDAAPAGGDLVARVFGTVHPPGVSWGTWVRSGGDPMAVQAQLADSPWGVVVMGSDTNSADSGATLAAAVGRLTSAGWLVVLDAGSAAVGSAALAAGIGVGAAVVLAIPQRVGDANRARWFLSGLASRYGGGVVADAVVAICEQDGCRPEVGVAVAGGLAGKVSATVSVPLDEGLATGKCIEPAAIGEPVRAAAREIISAAATHRRSE